MASRSLKRFLLLPAAYLAAILALLLVQFSGGERFSEKAGALVVSGSRSRPSGAGEVARLQQLRIGFQDLGFSFGSDGVEVAYSDGRTDKLDLAGYKAIDAGVEVSFAGGLSLRFATGGGEPSTLQVTARASSLAPDSIRLRYGAPGAFQAQESGGWVLPLEGGRILLAARAKLEVSGGTVVLGRSDAGYAPARFERAASADKSPLAQFMGQSVLDGPAYAAAIAPWLDKSYAGLLTGRFSPAKGGWARADGKHAFSERALVAALAEGMRRGRYPETRERFLDLIAANRGALGWLSATMLGSIRLQSDKQVAQDAAKAKALVAMIEAGDPRVFEDRDLLLSSSSVLRFLLDRASYTAAESFILFASEYDGGALGLGATMGLLRCAIDARELLPAESNPFAKFESMAEAALVPLIKKMREGYFLVQGGACDLLDQLIAGSILGDLAPLVGKEVYLGIGQNLVMSALGLADSAGGIPESVEFADGALASSAGSLPAESFYPLVAENPYYPYELSLVKLLGPGVWAWTSSPGLEVEADATRISFNASYPISRSHFIALHGVKPFSKIQIYGLDYRSDPNFEQYDSSGWVYDERDKVLYLKLKHKAAKEAVKLFYKAP